MSDATITIATYDVEELEEQLKYEEKVYYDLEKDNPSRRERYARLLHLEREILRLKRF